MKQETTLNFEDYVTREYLTRVGQWSAADQEKAAREKVRLAKEIIVQLAPTPQKEVYAGIDFLFDDSLACAALTPHESEHFRTLARTGQPIPYELYSDLYRRTQMRFPDGGC